MPATTRRDRALPVRPRGANDSSRGVLVVEDEGDLSEALVDLLREEGHAVYARTHLEEARAAFVELAPETVLVDYYLAGETTEDWLAEISAHANVILMSATSAARAHAERHQVQFLAKPFELDALLSMLDTGRRSGA